MNEMPKFTVKKTIERTSNDNQDPVPWLIGGIVALISLIALVIALPK